MYEEQGCETFLEQEKQLTRFLCEELSGIEEVVTYLPPDESHVGIVACNIKGYQSADVGVLLDEDYHIALRTGYHCAPYVHKHLKNEGYGGVMRISIGRYTTADDIERLVKAVREIVGG